MMNIDEPIHLGPYQESWREAFAHEEGVLVRKLGIRIVAVEHFGSTYVPGMTAKPIVDLLVGVADVCQADEVISQLQEQGYAFLGEAGIPGRLYFRKREAQSFNAHVVRYQGEIWNHNLILRNYLRAHPADALWYSEVKRAAVQKGLRTLLAYSKEKEECIKRLLEKAKRWASIA